VIVLLSIFNLFVADCLLLENIVPRITPSSLQVTRRGRVTLEISNTESGEQYDEFLAPEYRSGLQVACDASLEKVRTKHLGPDILCNIYPAIMLLSAVDFMVKCEIIWWPRETYFQLSLCDSKS
jgi:hypothetical protein